jgi:hypothetical protein
MGINFPSSPTAGQIFVLPQTYGNGPLYRFSSGAWRRNAGTALKTNKIVNGSMQVSQQFGDAGLICLAGYVCYSADQWMSAFSGSTTAQINSQRVALTTPRGSKYRFQLNVTTAQATLTGTDYVIISQYIEGNRVADLLWGTAAGKYAVLRFGFRGPAGTYSFFLRNGANDRSFFREFTISASDANKDVEYSYSIPPDVTGAWTTDNGLGLQVGISIAIIPGANPSGVWLAGGATSGSGITNNINQVGKTFQLFDVGFHADPGFTGVAPEFQARDFEDDLQDCLRYWYKCTHLRGAVGTATYAHLYAPHYVPMRIAPSQALVGAALRLYDGAVPNVTSIDTAAYDDANALTAHAAAGGLTPGRACNLLSDSQTASYIAINARM